MDHAAAADKRQLQQLLAFMSDASFQPPLSSSFPFYVLDMDSVYKLPLA